jgi:hypothetical protein
VTFVKPAVSRTDFGLPAPDPDQFGFTPYANVIWYDPGSTTGWALFSIHPDALEDPEAKILDNIHHWSCGEWIGAENEQAMTALALAEAWEDAAVGSEDFVLRTANAAREVLSPVRIVEKIDYGLWAGFAGNTPDQFGDDGEVSRLKMGRRLYKQMASYAKGAVTDDRLRSWGLYRHTVGLEHGRDAVRHGLTFLRRAKKDATLRREAWPLRFE